MRIRWSMGAADDLAAIKDYLHDLSPKYAERTVRLLYERVQSLKRFPMRGRPGLEPGSRELPIPPLPYVVLYVVTPHAVQILRIYHGAQNWKQ